MHTGREYGGTSGINPELSGVDPPQLTLEDYQHWRNCLKKSLIQYAIPIATAFTFISRFSKVGIYKPEQSKQKKFVRNVGIFLTNVFLVMVIRSTYCVEEVKKRYLSNMGKDGYKQQAWNINKDVRTIESDVRSQDDVNFQSNLDPNLDGPDSNFSHLDLDSNTAENLQLEDNQGELSKIPRTTYDDLRRRNRENYYRQFISSPAPNRDDQQLIIAPEPQKQKPRSSYPSTSTKKNKYGDDVIE